MASNGPSPAPNRQGLTAQTAVSPALVGYPYLGILTAWSDKNGNIWLARNSGTPPYQGDLSNQQQMLNPDWKTFEPPALAVSLELNAIFLAWTDPQGSIHLASSLDGWSSDQVFGPASSFGPALIVVSGQVLVGYNRGGVPNIAPYVVSNGQLSGTDNQNNPGVFISSRPTLAAGPGRLFVLSGGAPNGQGDQTMRIFDLKNNTPIPTPAANALGPPSMAFVNGNYHLVWADGDTQTLCHAVTTNFDQFAVTRYPDACNQGGPALAGLPDTLTIGWSSGSESPGSYNVALLGLPLQGGEAAMNQAQQQLIASDRRRAFVGQCGPFETWNPATQTCVPQDGCWGRCALENFDVLFDLPIFNIVGYALCVASCKARE